MRRRRFLLNADYIIILVTAANQKEAKKIAKHLLGERLIACANIIGPVNSFFQWSGKVDHAKEYLLLMKSKKNLFGRLTEAVKAVHSYKVPEMLAVPIVVGSNQYLDWLESCLA